MIARRGDLQVNGGFKLQCRPGSLIEATEDNGMELDLASFQTKTFGREIQCLTPNSPGPWD